MTIGKLQARGGKLPTVEQLEELIREHPAPPAQGEVTKPQAHLQPLPLPQHPALSR